MERENWLRHQLLAWLYALLNIDPSFLCSAFSTTYPSIINLIPIYYTYIYMSPYIYVELFVGTIFSLHPFIFCSKTAPIVLVDVAASQNRNFSAFSSIKFAKNSWIVKESGELEPENLLFVGNNFKTNPWDAYSRENQSLKISCYCPFMQIVNFFRQL